MPLKRCNNVINGDILFTMRFFINRDSFSKAKVKTSTTFKLLFLSDFLLVEIIKNMTEFHKMVKRSTETNNNTTFIKLLFEFIFLLYDYNDTISLISIVFWF